MVHQRSHLRDPGTLPLRQSTVVPVWVGDRPRLADLPDDSRIAGAASEVPEHGLNIVTHSDSRKRADVAHKSTRRSYQRTAEGIKLRGSNQYPTIVGLANHQPFRYLGVINSTLQLIWSLRMSTCGQDLKHIHQIWLRLSSSCDTRCNATPFYMFNLATMEYERTSTNSKMETSHFFEQMSTFHQTNNSISTESLMMDALSMTWHPVCLILDCSYNFRAQENQVKECTHRQLIVFSRNLANC